MTFGCTQLALLGGLLPGLVCCSPPQESATSVPPMSVPTSVPTSSPTASQIPTETALPVSVIDQSCVEREDGSGGWPSDYGLVFEKLDTWGQVWRVMPGDTGPVQVYSASIPTATYSLSPGGSLVAETVLVGPSDYRVTFTPVRSSGTTPPPIDWRPNWPLDNRFGAVWENETVLKGSDQVRRVFVSASAQTQTGPVVDNAARNISLYRLSPDSTTLAWIRDGELGFSDPDFENTVLINRPSGVEWAGFIYWSPASDRIVVRGRRDGYRVEDLYVITRYGDVQQATGFGRNVYKFNPREMSWAPSGDSLALWAIATTEQPAQTSEDRIGLYILNLSKGVFWDLCLSWNANLGLVPDRTIAWSPDGQELVFPEPAPSGVAYRVALLERKLWSLSDRIYNIRTLQP